MGILRILGGDAWTGATVGRKYVLAALVCRVFCGEAPSSEPTPNHIDLDRGNNKPKNQEWSSKQEQVEHSFANNASREHDEAET